MNLNVSIGKELDSEKEVFLDFAKDHINTVVFSGPTGSGKSTFHHSITKQIIKNNSPKEVGFIFMDFKRVEFYEYKDSEYLNHSIIYEPKEAVKVLEDLINESEQRFIGNKSSEKAIIVHIEESDIFYYNPNILLKVWKTISEQSEKNNIYIFFSTSRPSPDIFTKEFLDCSSLKGVFIPGDEWYKFYDGEIDSYSSNLLGKKWETIPKPWTKIFQLKNEKEIICKSF